MGKAQTNEKHPKGFYACCITFMFERLAFYYYYLKTVTSLCILDKKIK